MTQMAVYMRKIKDLHIRSEVGKERDGERMSREVLEKTI